MAGRSFQGVDGEMNRKIVIGMGGLLLALAMALHSSPVDFPKLSGPYLGQKPPGMTPEVIEELRPQDVQKGAAITLFAQAAAGTCAAGIRAIRTSPIAPGEMEETRSFIA
jgi:alpha-beta hydrolase superfamily lysophospholipase